MNSLGHNFVPAPIHAGGLRYHGMAPLVSAALRDEFDGSTGHSPKRMFRSWFVFAKTEGIIPAPETTHAIAATIREAKKPKKKAKKK